MESERCDENLGEVLIEKHLHEAVSSFDWASSSRAPRTASSVSVGYARTISGIVMPAASDSRRNAIDIRVPSTRGLPPRCSGSATIHFIVRFPPLSLTLSHFLRVEIGRAGIDSRLLGDPDYRGGGPGRVD